MSNWSVGCALSSLLFLDIRAGKTISVELQKLLPLNCTFSKKVRIQDLLHVHSSPQTPKVPVLSRGQLGKTAAGTFCENFKIPSVL